jgi:hypothetical protein
MIFTPRPILSVIKSIRMRWARHVGCMGERSGVYRVKNHLEDPGLNGRILLRWIFWECGLDRTG